MAAISMQQSECGCSSFEPIICPSLLSGPSALLTIWTVDMVLLADSNQATSGRLLRCSRANADAVRVAHDLDGRYGAVGRLKSSLFRAAML
eukprot:scaffold15533_cov141-Skeletonema_menzelii.AAC.1